MTKLPPTLEKEFLVMNGIVFVDQTPGPAVVEPFPPAAQRVLEALYEGRQATTVALKAEVLADILRVDVVNGESTDEALRTLEFLYLDRLMLI